MDKYEVKTDAFEGPLDLLLNLIEGRKLFINDISLAQISDSYISYVRDLQNFSMKDLADFIVIASTLMLIKSKSLLPTLNLTQEEEQNIDELEERLKIYQEMKKLSGFVSESFGKQIIFEKTPNKMREPIFSPDKNINLSNITMGILNVLKNLPKKEIIPQKIIKKVISLDEMIGNLTQRIKANLKMSFSDFSGIGKKDRVDVVISFLAMLELVKQGSLLVQQDSKFGEIGMESGEVETPMYTA